MESKCSISGGKHNWSRHTGLCLLCGEPKNPDLHRECTGRVEEASPPAPACAGTSHELRVGSWKCIHCGKDCEADILYSRPLSPVHEQQPPQPATGDVWLLVMKDMEERRQHGIAKYGQPVQADNGRDHLIDAYQEALDLCVYLRAEIERRQVPEPSEPNGDDPLNTAVEALKRIVESDPGPAYYIAKGALESIEGGEDEQDH